MKQGIIKVTFLGESTTGKSTIAKRIVHNEFKDTEDSTIGAAFLTLKTDSVRLDIWDTGGQERYLALCGMYYRNTDIFLLVFDVNNLSTIDRLKYYIDKIQKEIVCEYNVIVVGNKMDLIKESELDSIDKIVRNKLACETIIDKIEFIYLSAKNGYNCLEFLNKIIQLGQQIDEKRSLIVKNQIINLYKKTDGELVKSVNNCSC